MGCLRSFPWEQQNASYTPEEDTHTPYTDLRRHGPFKSTDLYANIRGPRCLFYIPNVLMSRNIVFISGSPQKLLHAMIITSESIIPTPRTFRGSGSRIASSILSILHVANCAGIASRRRTYFLALKIKGTEPKFSAFLIHLALSWPARRRYTDPKSKWPWPLAFRTEYSACACAASGKGVSTLRAACCARNRSFSIRAVAKPPS